MNDKAMITLSIEVSEAFLRLLLELSERTDKEPGQVLRNALVLLELAVMGRDVGADTKIGTLKVAL